jgi:hypothetical protein
VDSFRVLRLLMVSPHFVSRSNDVGPGGFRLGRDHQTIARKLDHESASRAHAAAQRGAFVSGRRHELKLATSQFHAERLNSGHRRSSARGRLPRRRSARALGRQSSFMRGGPAPSQLLAPSLEWVPGQALAGCSLGLAAATSVAPATPTLAQQEAVPTRARPSSTLRPHKKWPAPSFAARPGSHVHGGGLHKAAAFSVVFCCAALVHRFWPSKT